jgi:hypothetical protein
MARLLAEIAGVRSEAADLRADLTAQKVRKGQMNIMRALQIAREKRWWPTLFASDLFWPAAVLSVLAVLAWLAGSPLARFRVREGLRCPLAVASWSGARCVW